MPVDCSLLAFQLFIVLVCGVVGAPDRVGTSHTLPHCCQDKHSARGKLPSCLPPHSTGPPITTTLYYHVLLKQKYHPLLPSLLSLSETTPQNTELPIPQPTTTMCSSKQKYHPLLSLSETTPQNTDQLIQQPTTTMCSSKQKYYPLLPSLLSLSETTPHNKDPLIPQPTTTMCSSKQKYHPLSHFSLSLFPFLLISIFLYLTLHLRIQTFQYHNPQLPCAPQPKVFPSSLTFF